MAEVQQRAQIGGLALVGDHDPRLCGHALFDRMAACGGIAGQQCRPVFLAPAKEFGIVDQAVFDDLGIARALFAQRQRIQHIGIDQHETRLMKGADQVLAGAAVDRGLAANRTVDLRQQRRRDLDEPAAAFQDRCRKADKIADHAAAQRNDIVAALDFEFEQPVGQRFKLRPAFRRLAGGQLDDMLFDTGQRGLKAGQLMFSHVRIGDDDRAVAADPRG